MPKPEKMYKSGMHLLIYYEDVDQLRERLISVWCELDQSAAVSYTHLTLPTILRV